MIGAPFATRGDLVLTRTFDAPRKLVFKAWTDPKHLALWWGPRGFTTEIREMDVKPGGAWRYIMRGPDGHEYPFDGVYVEVVEPERLVFDGSIHASPEQRVWTEVTFADREGKTEITVRQSYSFESDATRGASVGWNQQLDRLGEFLAKP
ncbi:MAG TPA: SRPBCC domain-containing protein [Bryobacteraceae bacterium]|nr:SRPBCC domain-containing protein [Bryobacteraceae bacterium]